MIYFHCQLKLACVRDGTNPAVAAVHQSNVGDLKRLGRLGFKFKQGMPSLGTVVDEFEVLVIKTLTSTC